jgi:hypothetical protein
MEQGGLFYSDGDIYDSCNYGNCPDGNAVGWMNRKGAVKSEKDVIEALRSAPPAMS